MPKIDAHQHFWNYDPVRDDWITDSMQILRKDFTPSELEPLLLQHGFEGCIAVQSVQAEAENEFLIGYAEQHDFIKGVVGWIDLKAENVKERLEVNKRFKKLKGFRHILQGASQRDMMLKPEFKKGIGLLHQFGFTYDILIYPDQLPFAIELVAGFPDQKFVVDHLAKPYIKFKKMGNWKNDIVELAQQENVYCKISGMVTEADWQEWKAEDFKPYIDTVVEAFGTSRIMFGSDWPVCLVAADYSEVVRIAEEYFSSYSKHEQDQFFGLNAKTFYNL